MGKLSEIIIHDLKKYDKQILLVRNTDHFFQGPDRTDWLEENGILIFTGRRIQFRIFYETVIRPGYSTHDQVIYLVNNQDQVLEDIKNDSLFLNFMIRDYLPEFHEDILVQASTMLLDYLYNNRPLRNLNKRETIKYVVENYFEVDADYFGSAENVFVKWMHLYLRREQIPDFIKEFMIQPSAEFVEKSILWDKKSLFGYLQQEWGKYVNKKESEIDFTHQGLASILNISFLNGLLDPSETKVSESINSLIPFGVKNVEETISAEQLKVPLIGELDVEDIRWDSAIVPISEVIKTALRQGCYEQIDPLIQKLNKRFQVHLEEEYKDNILPSSYIRRPKIVSKVLDHIANNHQNSEMVAFLVIDGMAYWQWLMIKNELEENEIEADHKLTYSWLPSITQLSRQAIFKGSTPVSDYRQSPTNERKLWSEYWSKKNIPVNQIDYQHGSYNLQPNVLTKRLAFVDTTLDEKMHSCGNYQDLYSLTENWVRSEKLLDLIKKLKALGYTIYITTDHGNVQAKGWRNLRQTETFGANRSGSRSKRHLEYYVDKSLADKFININHEIKSSIKKDGAILYLQDNSAFTNKDIIVTHGGSHLTEVLIPFVKIL